MRADYNACPFPPPLSLPTSLARGTGGPELRKRERSDLPRKPILCRTGPHKADFGGSDEHNQHASFSGPISERYQRPEVRRLAGVACATAASPERAVGSGAHNAAGGTSFYRPVGEGMR